MHKKQKAPTGIVAYATNSIGAAHSALFPTRHLIISIADTHMMSMHGPVDILGSVEDRGIAPLEPQVTSRGRHYASPTVFSLYLIS